MPLIALLEPCEEGVPRTLANAMPRTVFLPIRSDEDAQSLIDRIRATSARGVLLRGLPVPGFLLRLAAEWLPAVLVLTEAEWDCAQREAAEGLPRARELWLAHAVFAPKAPDAWPADVPKVALRLSEDRAIAEANARALLDELAAANSPRDAGACARWPIAFAQALQSSDFLRELRSFRSGLKQRSEAIRGARARLLLLSGDRIGADVDPLQTALDALEGQDSPFEVIVRDGLSFGGLGCAKPERDPLMILADLERLVPDLVLLRGAEAAAFGRLLTWLGWPTVLCLEGDPNHTSRDGSPNEGLRASLRALPSCVVFGESTADQWSPFVRIPKLARLASREVSEPSTSVAMVAQPPRSLGHFLEEQLIMISAIGARPPFAGSLARARARGGFSLLQAFASGDAAAFRRALRALTDLDRPARRTGLLGRIGSFWKSLSARA